jgi:hypothetical protein
MMWSKVIPVIMVLLVALVILVLVLHQRRKSQDLVRQERVLAEKDWDGVCQFDNPETGAKCQRLEFHLENHYRSVNGKLVTWP